MTQNRANPIVQRIGFAALLAVILAGCGGGGTTTPPPPPPFVPQTITVSLGEHGGSITLRTTQAGGYTRDGQAFTSGTEVEAENGNRYRVTLTGQTWAAEFLPPDPVDVQLGTSGDTVSITQLEDRSYQADGQALGEDRIVTADNGNMYRLTLVENEWMSEFVPPDAVAVTLGSSGDTVSITQLEDRSYQVDGQPLGEDRIVTADNGNMYRLTLGDTGWMWEFVPPDAVAVTLGSSGDTVSITQLEDRSYQVDGQPLADDRIVTADNGNMYRLTLGDTGWMWEFVAPDAVALTLGSSGDTVSITQQEDRTYLVDGQPLAADRIVTAGNGNMYRLTLGETGWMWEFVPPDAVAVTLGSSGDTVSITQQEDRTYLADGQPLGSDGIVTADNGNMYRLTLVEDEWMWEFVPAPADMLTLGSSGDTVSITRAEDGSYLVNGNPLPGNRIVTASNGNMYRLSLDAAGWSWDFVPPTPEELALGTSGTTVEITRREDGSYLVDGRPLASGDIVEAANGNRYRLNLSGSVWQPEFIAPQPVAVPLGTSGTAVLITRREDGTYIVDGQPLANDRIVTAANGHRYRLTLTGGTWSAAFAATPFSVSLGRLGGTRTLELREDGKYWLGNTEVSSGDIITGDNQKRYMLQLRDGVWTGVYQAETFPVRIGDSEEVLDVIVRLEDDTYVFGTQVVESGDTITASDGNEYTLSRDSSTGMWSAMFRTITIALGTSGDTVELRRRADGTYERDGEVFTSGEVVFDSNGIGYKVELTASGWTTRIYCVAGVAPCADATGPDPPAPPPPTTREDNLETVESLPTDRPPTFKRADESPSGFRGTTLVIAGTAGSTTPQEYELQDLLGRGVVEDTRTYVDSVRTAIQNIRHTIVIRDQAFSTGALDPHEVILGAGGSWDLLKTALEGIFGSSTEQRAAITSFLGDPPTGRRDTNLDYDEVADVLAIIDEVLDSLSTLAKFEADVFGDLVAADGTALTGLTAEEVYEASFSRLQFGSSRNTRFAAYAIQQTGGSASVAATWDVGAFAYSPLEVSTRAMIPNRGEAEFNGDTIAVQAGITATGETTLYSGDIELRVRFGTGRVLGLITNLRDENNNLWTYDGTAIESIRLPIGQMASGAPGDATFTASGNSDLRFVSATPTSTFQGKFVGDDSDEADAVLGTWTIAEVSTVQGAISGAFGAEYSRTRRSQKPALESSPRGSRAESSIDFTLDADGEVTLGLFQGIDPSRLYPRGTSVFRSTDSNQTLSVTVPQGESVRLTVQYRKTDYTRYGVWEQEKGADDTVSIDPSQGVFAYSYLEPTVFSTDADSDHVYPENISATYRGQTIAQDRATDPLTYTGTIEMTVNWESALSSAELDSVVIRNLRSGSTSFAIDGEIVDRIVMAGTVSFTGASDGIRFTSTTSDGMEVWYRDPLLNRSRLGGGHDGNFVGLSLDGPVAVFGKWSVNGTGGSLAIEGAYGAELQP